MRPYWIDPSLAVAAAPWGGSDLAAEMADLRTDGVDVVLSCLTPAEAEELELADEAAAARRAGLRFWAYPMADFGLPADRASFLRLIAQMRRARGRGQHLLIHCRGGLGRSPLLAACLLIREGQDAGKVLNTISAIRGALVPETQAQYRWIREYARSVRPPRATRQPRSPAEPQP
jgi:protein-tyrosine phosphatase